MTLAIVLHAVALACATGLVAIGLECLAVRCVQPRRMVWMLAMLVSILLPPALLLGAASRSAAPEPVSISHAPVQSIPLLPGDAVPSGSTDMVGSHSTSMLAPVPATDSSLRLPQLDSRFLLWTWALGSGLLLAGLAVLTSLQQRRSRMWTRASLLGHPVLVSDDTGPALFGVLHPRVVIPRWLLDEPDSVQALVIAHEREHARARDPLLLRAGLLIAVLVPWNLPLWWQWSRLRLAIEMDCDARVLTGGADAAQYAEVLLGVVRKASLAPIAVVAMSEPVSALERRIRSLLDPRRLAFPALLGASAMAAFGVTLLVLLRTPELPAPAEESTARVDGTGLHAAPSSPRSSSIEVPASRAVSDERGASGEAPGTRQVASAAVREPAREPQLPLLPPPAAKRIPEGVLQALLRRYPEVAAGPARPGIIDAALVLKADGTLYRSALAHPTPQEPYGSAQGLEWIMPRDAGPAIAALLKQGSRLPGGATLRSAVSLRYLVLPADYDAARSPELVQAALMAARPDLFLPVGSDQINRVTVFMTDDGRIDRLYNEPKHRTEQQPVPPVDVATWSPIFEPLGLKAEELGSIGLIHVHARPEEGRLVPASSEAADGPDRRRLIVRFAWPRRAGEPPGGWRAAARTNHQDEFDTAAAHAIVQHYLPEVFEAQVPMDTPPAELPDAGIPAIALDSSGKVLLATRLPSHHGMSPDAVRALQSRLPESATLGRFVSRPVLDAKGTGSPVLFAWDVRTSQEEHR